MPTILSFLSGRQITNDSGVPQSGAKLLHYREGTTTALTVWQNDAASVAHAQPVECDAGGFVPLIYVDDTFDWKVIITTSADVTLKTYDNLPKAEADAGAVGFAPTLLEWTQVTSASSPVALVVGDAGKAYEADTTGGSIEFDLPGAASVGNGKGFWFKKTAAANTMTIDPSSTETIDDVSTSLAITAKDTLIGIFSNGAEWYVVDGYGMLPINNKPQDLVAASAAVALTDAATIALDWTSGVNFTVTLGGNRTLGNPTNGIPGTWRRIQFTQDGTGTRTITWDTQYVHPGGANAVLSTTASAVDSIYIYCRTTSIFEVHIGGLAWAT